MSSKQRESDRRGAAAVAKKAEAAKKAAEAPTSGMY